MSEFRTIVDVEKGKKGISYIDNLFLIGSCFTENIGNRLSQYKFNTYLNPNGIIYNPASIIDCLTKILDDYKFDSKDLIEQQGLWNSMYHHSKFAQGSSEKLLDLINNNQVKAKQQLLSAGYVLITLGTAWVYKYNKTQKVVCNCHKIPAKEFTRYRLDASEIISGIKNLIKKIRLDNPKAKFIFTVSPVRHLKDGSVENQLSKATLIMAVQQLVNELQNVSYFPAYEIMMDDLRDYRFYNEDMVHPSNMAVEYIWEKFKNAWVSEKTFVLMNKIEKIQKAVQHKPFQPEAPSHQKFISKQLELIGQIKKENSSIDFTDEIKYFKSVLI